MSELSEEKQLELVLFQSQLDLNPAASKHARSWMHDYLRSRNQLSSKSSKDASRDRVHLSPPRKVLPPRKRLLSPGRQLPSQARQQPFSTQQASHLSTGASYGPIGRPSRALLPPSSPFKLPAYRHATGRSYTGGPLATAGAATAAGPKLPLSLARTTGATAVAGCPQLSEFYQQAIQAQTRPDLLNVQQRALLDAYDPPAQWEPLDSSQPVKVVTKQQVQKCLLLSFSDCVTSSDSSFACCAQCKSHNSCNIRLGSILCRTPAAG